MNENQTSQSPKKPKQVCIAAIAGAFGVKGEVKIKSFTDDPKACLSYGPLRNQSGEVVLTIKRQRTIKNGFAVFAKEISTREQAEAMKGTKLYVAREALPDPEDNEFYYTDLIGLSVESIEGDRLGRIKAVHDFGGGDILEIQAHGEKDWYHPFTQTAVPEVDIKGRRVVIEVVEPDIAKDPNEKPDKPNRKEGGSNQTDAGLDDLYNTDILSLAAKLKNESLEMPDGTSRKVSKLCGSWLEIDVAVKDGKVTDVALRVQACALGQASAAILKDNIVGSTLAELEDARKALRAMLKEAGTPPTGRFSDLKFLSSVRAYPARHTSTMLAFEAAVEAVETAISSQSV